MKRWRSWLATALSYAAVLALGYFLPREVSRWRQQRSFLPTTWSIGQPRAAPFAQDGTIVRREGPLRVYLATHARATLDRTTEIPILVVLENDTYRPVLAKGLGLGAEKPLFTTVVSRLDADAAHEVFRQITAVPSYADWRGAERKSFALSWPVAAVSPGRYRVSVIPGFGSHAALEAIAELE
jgi:hypothetical protein